MIFFANVKIFSVLQGFSVDHKKAYLAYHHSHEVDRKAAPCFGWFPCVGAGGEVLDILAQLVTTAIITTNNAQMKMCVGAVSVEWKHERKNALEEATDAVSSVVDSSADFTAPVVDATIIEDVTFKKDAF